MFEKNDIFDDARMFALIKIFYKLHNNIENKLRTKEYFDFKDLVCYVSNAFFINKYLEIESIFEGQRTVYSEPILANFEGFHLNLASIGYKCFYLIQDKIIPRIVKDASLEKIFYIHTNSNYSEELELPKWYFYNKKMKTYLIGKTKDKCIYFTVSIKI